MTGIYRKLLEQLDAQPAQVTQRRVSLSKPHKLVIAGTSLARGLL
jgi:phytoene/squalene synthetase